MSRQKRVHHLRVTAPCSAIARLPRPGAASVFYCYRANDRRCELSRLCGYESQLLLLGVYCRSCTSKPSDWRCLPCVVHWLWTLHPTACTCHDERPGLLQDCLLAASAAGISYGCSLCLKSLCILRTACRIPKIQGARERGRKGCKQAVVLSAARLDAMELHQPVFARFGCPVRATYNISKDLRDV